MAGERENLNLQLETSEFMDQPFVQQDHVVVTIPPALDDSSIASSSSSIGSQTLNLPLITPHEDDLTDLSTSSAANTQVRSYTPQQQRSRWNNPCFLLTFDFCSTIIQIILLVVFFSIFQDEHPHLALRVWAIGYGAGCLVALPLLYCTYKHLREQSNQLLQTISTISSGSEVGELQTSQRQRFGKVLKWLWTLLHGFFVLWFWVGIGMVDTSWASRQAPHLNRLCRVFLVITYFRFILPLTICIARRCYGVHSVPRIFLREWPRRASANVISALPTYQFHARETLKEEDDVRVIIEGDEPVEEPVAEVVECCICLDLYEDGVELKELPCTHHFHVKCIDQWLKINGSCPICKNEVGTSSRASATEPTFTIVTL